MSLLSEIPGLSAHDTKPASRPTKPPVVVSFDNASAYELIRQAVNDVAAAYPSPDPWGWLLENRPEIITKMKQLGNAMNFSYLVQDMDGVKEAADKFRTYHLAAWKIYEERPKVVQVQGDLLLAAQ